MVYFVVTSSPYYVFRGSIYYCILTQVRLTSSNASASEFLCNQRSWVTSIPISYQMCHIIVLNRVNWRKSTVQFTYILTILLFVLNNNILKLFIWLLNCICICTHLINIWNNIPYGLVYPVTVCTYETVKRVVLVAWAKLSHVRYCHIATDQICCHFWTFK